MLKKAATSRLQRLAILLVLVAGVAIVSGPTASGSGVSAAFDYSMPPRLGDDANNDGIIDARTTHGAVDPASWHVDFNACASSGSIARYRWSIDGSFAGESATCNGFSHDFANEGTYSVALTTTDSGGNPTTVTKDVVVQDFLIVAFGDSYGSGEGNPDKPIPGFKYDHVRDAQQTLKQKLDALTTAQHNFNATQQQATRVFNRLSDLNHANGDIVRFCNPLGPDYNADACAQATIDAANATAALLDALTDLGQQGLIDALDQIT
jgi:PKD domain